GPRRGGRAPRGLVQRRARVRGRRDVRRQGRQRQRADRRARLRARLLGRRRDRVPDAGGARQERADHLEQRGADDRLPQPERLGEETTMRPRTHTHGSRRGNTLIAVVVLLGTMVVLSLIFLRVGQRVSKEELSTVDAARASYLAEAGVSEA